jgi:hypothetical protein
MHLCHLLLRNILIQIAPSCILEVVLMINLSIFPIELHAPTSSTQKLKLMRKGGQCTYTPTRPLTCRLPHAAYVEIWSGAVIIFN